MSRSESSRPRVIGWSPRRWFSRLKTRKVSCPSELAGSDVAPLLMLHAERLRQALRGGAERGVIGDQQEGAAIPDPVADGIALGIDERRIGRLALARCRSAAHRVGDDQDVALPQARWRENLSRLGTT